MSSLPSPVSTPVRPSLFGLTRPELKRLLTEQGVAAYRADQIFSWIYQKHRMAPEAMTNLPATLKGCLADVCDPTLPRVAQALETRDGQTHKFVLELSDGARVECVSMRTEKAPHLLYFEPGGMRAQMRLLCHRADGLEAQPRSPRDRRTGSAHG